MILWCAKKKKNTIINLERRKMKKLCLFIATALLLSCNTVPAKNNNAKEFNKFASFNATGEIELQTSVFPAGKYAVSLNDKSDSNGEIKIFISFPLNEDEEYYYPLEMESVVTEDISNKPVLLPVKTDGDILEIAVKYRDRIYTAAFQYVPETLPEPYKTIGEVKSPYVKKEFALIMSVQEFLDKNADMILRNWKDWKYDSIFITFPDKTKMALAYEKKLPHLFRPIEGLRLFGKQVFVNESDAVPPVKKTGKGEILGNIHGDADSEGIFIHITELFVPEGIFFSKQNNDPDKVSFSEENEDIRFFVYIHESFHREQWRRRFKAANEGKSYINIGEPIDTSTMSTDTAVYTSLEGLYLKSAYNEQDNNKAFMLFKKACAARYLKHSSLPETAVQHDKYKTLIEGTAVYSEYRAASLKKDKASQKHLKRQLNSIDDIRSDSTGHFGTTYYMYGMYWSLLLDRFSPEWIQNIFQEIKTIDDKLYDILPSASLECKEISEDIKNSKEYTDVVMEYKPKFDRRDEVVGSFGKLGGIHYIVDFSKIKITGFNIDPYELVLYGHSQYYPKGLNEFVMNSFKLKSNALSFCYSRQAAVKRSILEWYDPRYNTAYKINGTKNGNIYEKLSIEADGIKFTINKAEVRESDNEVIIYVLE